MRSEGRWIVLAEIFFLLLTLHADNIQNFWQEANDQGIKKEVHIVQSPFFDLDFRKELGGCLARQKSFLAPIAQKEDQQVVCKIAGQQAPGWTFANPMWNSISLEDGWYDIILNEHGQAYSAKVAVLNNPSVVIHGGVLTQDEIWSADKIHLVRHWVRIPKGLTLTIEADTVVKFCYKTGICVEGTLFAQKGIFRSSTDDSVGGDTDMNGHPEEHIISDYKITGQGVMDLCVSGKETVESSYFDLDFRKDLGGCLARGKAFLAPVAKKEDYRAICKVDRQNAAEWSVENPLWNSTVLPDGWYDASLQEHSIIHGAHIAVLNNPSVVIHGGVLTQDEIWSADKIHLVRHWVRIPKGLTLIIADGAIVKFCYKTGIRADGTLLAQKGIFRSSTDDSVGGDTDMNGIQEEYTVSDYKITGPGEIKLCISGKETVESSCFNLDFRKDLGGCLARGKAFLASVAEKEDYNVSCKISNQPALEWSFNNPRWTSTFWEDGWYDASLLENNHLYSARVAVLNNPDVAVHGGVLKQDEFWAADKVHLVQHWIRIPQGHILTIADGSVVKFCQNTGIRVDGVLKASKVVFTVSGDDSIGGDTDMNGLWEKPIYDNFQIIGSGKMHLDASRFCFGERLNFSLKVSRGWNLLSLPGGITDAEKINQKLIHQWKPLIIYKGMFQRTDLPIPAGTAMWIYSSENTSIDFICSEKTQHSEFFSSKGNIRFIGVPRKEALKLDAEVVKQIWHWQDDHYKRVPRSPDGFFVLQPGKGYVIN